MFLTSRNEVQSILLTGLKAADPRDAVKKAISVNRGEVIIANRKVGRLSERNIIIIGAGKAAASMAQGVMDSIPQKIKSGIIIVPNMVDIEGINVRQGDHPLPSGRNTTYTSEVIDFVRAATAKDYLLVLISGGGSSLLEKPKEEVTLSAERKVIDALMKAGADIFQLNAVRKHISDVKGGQLINYFKGKECISLMVSDVLGDDLGTIASGPTVGDPTTYSDALSLLSRYKLLDDNKEIVDLLRRGANGEIAETPKPGDQLLNRVHNRLILNNLPSLNTMKRESIKYGYRPFLLTSAMQGEAREVGKLLASIAWNFKGRKIALIAGGETTVTVTGKGRGGRTMELVISAALTNQHLGSSTAIFGCISTDGKDGNTDAAGAIIGKDDMANIISMNPDLYLRNNDSYTLLDNLGLTVKTGPTGTNVNDLFIALCAG
jgi:glycerate-2-kinase